MLQTKDTGQRRQFILCVFDPTSEEGLGSYFVTLVATVSGTVGLLNEAWGLKLRQVMLINGILSNSKAWNALSEKALKTMNC